MTDKSRNETTAATRESRAPASLVGLGVAHNVRESRNEMDSRLEGMSEALLSRMQPNVAITDNGRRYRTHSLVEMGREFLELHGVDTRGLGRMEVAREMLQFRSGMHATGDFGSLLMNAAHKRLRSAYDENPGTYRIWARRAAGAPDFRNINVVQLSGAPDLLRTNEHGEFKYGTMADGEESYSLITYGRIVSLTRQAIVNDDLRAFDRLLLQYAASARRLENRLVYSRLTANAALSDGRQVVLTREQIQRADEYSDAQARSRAQLQVYAQALATEAVPALVAVQNATKDLIKQLLGVDKAQSQVSANPALLDWAETISVALATVTEGVVGALKLFRSLVGSVEVMLADTAVAFRTVRTAAAAFLPGDTFANENAALKKSLDDRDRILKEANDRYSNLWNYDGTKISTAIRKSFREQRAAMASLDNEARRRLGRSTGVAGDLAELDFRGKEKRPAGTGKDPEAEAKRYLENLQKQSERLRDVSTEEQALLDIQLKRLGIVSPALEKQILAQARVIDMAKAERESLEASAKAAEKAAVAAGRLADEAKRIEESVETPLERMQRRLEEISKQAENNPLLSAETVARVNTQAWNEYIQSIGEAKSEITELDQFNKRAAENIQDALGDGLYNVLTGNFKNIGQGFSNMVLRMIAQAQAAQLSRALFGDLVAGGTGRGAAGDLLGWFGSSLLGAGAGQSPTTGDFARLDRGQGGSGGFFGAIGSWLSGLASFDVGTPYVPEDMIAKVHKGERIVPAAQNRPDYGNGGGRGGVTLIQNFAPGTDRTTTNQAAGSAAAAIRRAQRFA